MSTPVVPTPPKKVNRINLEPEKSRNAEVGSKWTLFRDRLALDRECELPGGALFSTKWSSRIARRLARAQPTMRVRIARDELRRLRELTQAIRALETGIAQLVAQVAPQLLSEPGFGPLTAAKLVARSPAPAASLPTPSSPGRRRRTRSAC